MDKIRVLLVEDEPTLAMIIKDTLDGEEFEVPCAEGETLIGAMQRAGLNPPSSCLVGSCATCMCTLERGTVEMLRNDALDQQELNDGWVLACQSVPNSSQLRVCFPE